MADPNRSAIPWLAFLIGGLIVAIAVIGYVVFTGGGVSSPSVPDQIQVDVDLPKAPSIPDAPKLPDSPIPTPK